MPVPADYFSNITSWNSTQVTQYLVQQVTVRMAPNIAFAALAIVALVAFLLW